MRCVQGIRLHFLKIVVLATAWAGPPARADGVNSPYGVVAFIPSATRFDAMSDANIAWGRYDFSWRSVEAAGKGVYNWAAQDYAVAEANARGLHIYGGLGYTPTWASAAGNANSPPTNNQDWYDYVYATVSRYKGSVKYWEMWNEPDLDHFWGGTYAQFVELFKVGADAAHAADPDCMVVGPEISSAGVPTSWMMSFLQAAGNKIDIISFHQYGDYPGERLGNIDVMYSHIASIGYGKKPIWVSESGWASDDIGEQTQADYLTEMLEGMALRPWIKKFFWYQIWEGPTDLAGLLRQDETRKPVWQCLPRLHGGQSGTGGGYGQPQHHRYRERREPGDGGRRQHDARHSSQPRVSKKHQRGRWRLLHVFQRGRLSFAFEGDRPIVAIDVDYYDFGTGTLTLQYDSVGDGFYKSAGSVTLGNKDTWKQHTFYLEDAYFGNRQNNGADFRFSAGVGTTFYLDVVQVSESEIMPSPGDFNGDLVVDAADHVVWRKAAGVALTQINYNLWRRNFGLSTPGSGGSSSSPEPGSLLTVVSGLAMVLIGGRYGVSRAQGHIARR